MPGDVGATEAEVVFLGQDVIYLERILAGVRESWLGPDPVSRTLPESGRGQRVGVEQRPAIRTDAPLRDDVVGEGLAGLEIARCRAIVRVFHDGAPTQELIRRIEQFAKVAIAHRQRGHRPSGSILLPPINPLFGHEEEELAPIRVELAGDEDGAAYIEAELVEAECGWGGRDSRIITLVARPGVGVERRIAEVFNQVAVEVARAALGDEANLSPGRAPIFGGVIGRQDLHLLDRIHVLRAEHRAGRTCAGRDGPIHHDDVLIRPPAVDAEASVTYTVRVKSAD